LNLDETQKKLSVYFISKLEAFGATAKGVDYNGEDAQQMRFAELVSVIHPGAGFTVIDYGCGYGALYDFLQRRGWNFTYYGIDLIEQMVQKGRATHRDAPNALFTTDEKELPIADYVLAAGIFNIKLGATGADWQEHVCRTLQRMDALCSKGFAFNLLTKYSDADRMSERPDLYYADPLFYFDFCKRRFSRNVALLHDYGLYDFTILVRKDV